MAKIGDKNKFDFQEHRLRLGEIDPDGKLIQKPSLDDNLGRPRQCATITLTHPTKGEVQINAHELDSIATWQRLGYQTPEQIEGPKANAADIEARAKLKAELLAEIKAELTPTKSKKE